MTHGLRPRIARRQVLLGAGSLALACATFGTADAASPVTSGMGAPRKVLLHPVTRADFSTCGLISGANPLWLEAAEELVAEHVALASRLESTGAMVLYLEDVLQSAVDEARRRGSWSSWLDAAFPELVERQQGGAAMLLGRDGHDTGMQGLFRLGDLAVMLPQGMALREVRNPALVRPAALLRFMANHSPELRAYPLLEVRAASDGVSFAQSALSSVLILERA